MMIYQEAFAKANHYLDDADLPVVITLHGRFSQGWYFCFESQEFLESGDEAARLAGNAPFIIDKDSGEIHSLGTAKPLEEYLHDYEIKKLPSACPDNTALFPRRGPLTLIPRR